MLMPSRNDDIRVAQAVGIMVGHAPPLAPVMLAAAAQERDADEARPTSAFTIGFVLSSGGREE